MLLDGAATVETWDKSGELLHLRGMDVSSFQEMQAPVDHEHWSEKHAQGQFHEEGEDKPGSEEVVGRVLGCHKIYGPDDCRDTRQRYYWDKVRLPYLYVRFRLFDDAGHRGALALAAIIRSCKMNNEPMLLGLSVGGATMQRGPTPQGPELLATIARSLAITCRPCNAACELGVLSDPAADPVAKREPRLGGWTTLEVMDPEVPQDLLKDEAKLPKIPALKLPGSPTLTPLTQRGKPLPAGGADEVRFDEHKGILHTPRGSIPAYLPKQDNTEEHFHNILSTPEVEAAHGKAMEGWTRAHKLLREHRLPPEVVMHGVLFSHLSPNTPVSVQEEMYSYLMDAMKHTGHDARSPGFKSTLEHWHRRNPKRSWGIMPKHSREHFETDQPIRTKAGTIQGYALGEQKGVSMGRYHAMHDALTEIVGRHGRDARGAARELLGHKIAAGNWESRRKNAIKRGQPDPGEYQGGPHMAGLAPKTTRYALGMMGGGNVMVPDTHFIRHFYGMENVRDTDTIDHLKTVLNNEQNSHVLEGMDRWYAANHPAVRFMLQHPKWKHHFQAPEDAIFPAFWRHWMAIAPHEQARGMRTFENNQLTTHRPYWEAVDQHLKSEGLSTLPLRTAQLHQAYVREHGEVPALLLYLAHLLPQLLDEAGRREGRAQGTTILAGLHPRLEAAAQDLRGAAHDRGWADAPKVLAVGSRKGARLGRVMILNGRLHHLEDYRGLLGQVLPEGPLDDGAVARLDGLRASPHLSVTDDRPKDIGEDAPSTEVTPGNPANGTAAQQDVQPEPAPTEEEGGVATYLYRRAGMDQDHVLEVSGDAAYLDGRPLPAGVARLMLRNARNGAATLRPASLAKAGEGEMMDPEDALQHIRRAVAAGHIPPEVERSMTHHIFSDNMVPSMGSKYAYKRFLSRPRQGTHIMIDGNSFGVINKKFGQQVGDQAIEAYGKAAREAMDEAVGRDKGKLFRDPDQQDLYRDGGDEFRAYVPSHDHAVRFLQAFQRKLDQVPPIGGVHRLSASVGIGHTPEHANTAMNAAKQAKVAMGRKPGDEVSTAHSLTPGRAGSINLHTEAPPVHPEVPAKLPATV